jgi:hypothetical protein
MGVVEVKWRTLFHKAEWKSAKPNGTRMPLENKRENTSAKVECQLVPCGFGSASKRALSRFTKLAPTNSDAKTFAAWLPTVKADGTWMQDELYGWYAEVCHYVGFIPMPKNSFGFAMRDAGCRRYRADMRKGGKGKRVWMLDVPRELPAEVPRVPKASKSVPWPDMKPGPGISKVNAYATIKKNGGSFAALVKAA